MPQRRASRDREPRRRLVVVRQQRLLGRCQVLGLVVRNRVALRRVVVVLAREHLDAERDRLVAEVRLRKPEAKVARKVADVGLHRERLAQAQEVIRRVVQTDKRSRQSADAAVQPDRVLALLLQLQQEIDRSLIGILTALRVLLRLQRLEVVQLVQTQNRKLPQLVVVDLSLFQQKLSPNHLVARNRITRKLNPRDIERLALIDVDIEVDQLLRLIHPRNRRSYEVDISLRTVSLPQLLDTLPEQGRVEVLSVLLRKLCAERLRIGEVRISLEGDAAQLVSRTLFHRHQDVDPLALRRPQRKRIDPTRIANPRRRLARQSLEVSMIAIRLAHSLGVLVQLARVKRPSEQVLQNDRVRYSDRLQVPHRRPQRAVVDAVVAIERNLAHLHRRPFLHDEGQRHRCRWNRLDLGLDRRELVSVLREQFLQHHLGPLDLSRVILAVDREPDLRLLEPLQNVRLRNRIHTLVVDLANRRLLANIDHQLNALRSLRPFNPDVIEVPGVPQRVEVPLHHQRVVQVALMRKQPRQNRLLRNTTVSDHLWLSERLHTLLPFGSGRSDRRSLRRQRRNRPNSNGEDRHGISHAEA